MRSGAADDSAAAGAGVPQVVSRSTKEDAKIVLGRIPGREGARVDGGGSGAGDLWRRLGVGSRRTLTVMSFSLPRPSPTRKNTIFTTRGVRIFNIFVTIFGGASLVLTLTVQKYPGEYRVLTSC